MDEINEEQDRAALDPYLKKKDRFVKPQRFRTITVGPEDLLRDGQMVQVAISDAFDETQFHPADKILLVKHDGRYLALGSFCGFCYSNLGQGACIGEKLACPGCGSNYDITSGLPDQGPNLRNLSTFNCAVRKGQIEVTVPEHIPAFSKKKFVKREALDPRTIVVLGDNETSLAVIDSLRTSYTGRIVCVPCNNAKGAFENLDIMKRYIGPLSKNQCFLVEDDYLDRANVDIVKGEVRAIDVNKKQMVVKGLRKPLKFDKVIVAWGADQKRLN